MRNLIIVSILFLGCLCNHLRGQVVEEGDTLFLNYSISTGPTGISEGLIVYISKNETKAQSVRYTSIKSISSLDPDTIINVYKENKDNYIIIKPEWTLSEEQCGYIATLLDEIKAAKVKEDVYSTSPEHYVIITKRDNYVYIDVKKWRKYLEMKKVLNIDQCSKML